jgi:hypothetical protein
MEINGSTPKEIHYIRKLLDHFSENLATRLKQRIFNGDKKFTRSELAQILSHENDDYAYQFLDKLIEEEVLEQPEGEEGLRENASKTVPVFRFHKDRLVNVFADTDYYQENRDLFVDTLKKAENKELL